jgi:hypothetical protein
MAETTNRSAGLLPKKLRENLERIVTSTITTRPEFSQQIRDFLSAISYEDRVLMGSSLDALLDGFRLVVRDSLVSELRMSKATMDAVRAFLQEHVEGVLFEDDVEVPNQAIAAVVDERIVVLVGWQDDVVLRLEKMGHLVENAQALRDGILELRRFRETLLKQWPRVGEPLAPLDRQAIQEARSQIAQKGLRKEDMCYPKKTG